MLAMIGTVALAWAASSRHVCTTTSVVRTRRCAMASSPDERPEQRPEIKINKDAIVEFHDPKHGSGAQRPVLGLVQGAEYKAKGGARIMIIDAQGGKHAVKESNIHINLGTYKGKLVEPSAILDEYTKVMALEPTQLGVEPDVLEMAWELCAEAGTSTFSPKAILSLVDEKLYKNSLDAYKAFRLLTSDLGKVFFKSLNGNEYKAKASKAVEASKMNWCREHDELDYCFV
jgi:hypothetical protein